MLNVYLEREVAGEQELVGRVGTLEDTALVDIVEIAGNVDGYDLVARCNESDARWIWAGEWKIYEGATTFACSV